MLARTFFVLAFAAGGINAKPCRHRPVHSTPVASSILMAASTSVETPLLYPLPTQATSLAVEDSDALGAISPATEPTYASGDSDEPVASSPAVEPTYAAEPTDAPATTSYPVESPYVPVATPSYTTPLPPSETPSEGATVYSGGRATWYNQFNTPGACGYTHSDYDWIVAISINFDANPKQHCGKKVHITSETGTIHEAIIADTCQACLQPSLDLSVGLFGNFTDLDVGNFGIQQWYMSGEADLSHLAGNPSGTGNTDGTSNSDNTYNSGKTY